MTNPGLAQVVHARQRSTWLDRPPRARLWPWLLAWIALGCSEPPQPSDAPWVWKAVSRQVAQQAFVVLPDTQYYACGYPDIFRSQGRWIADNAEDLGVAIVVHTGDVVDLDVPQQWAVAADALHVLDPTVSYLIAAGNHDLRDDRSSLLNEFFVVDDLLGADREAAGLLSEARVDNSYAVVNLQGERWLLLGLEFAPRDATLEWASGVLEDYAQLPAVLFTHAYLYADGRRYDRTIQPLQPYHPDQYRVTPDQGIADGEDIWRALVEPNENVRLVLSGHVIPDGVARSQATRRSGSVVHQVLANYQNCGSCPCPEALGGGGYLRLFTLDPERTAFHVTTYSPYLDRYLDDADNEFDLALTRPREAGEAGADR